MSQSGEGEQGPSKVEPELEPNPGVVEAERANERDISPPRGHAFPVVGIGGSAGALDAFTRLLQALPSNTDMAFVFVQHLDPHHVSQLPEILTKNTAMPVRNVEDGMSIRPNEVYVIPPNATMVLEDGVLRLAQRNPGLHLPIDAFFQSLARVQGSRAIAVVLSGNASDGSQGVKAIKEESGLTFAQDEATAQHVGMPRNAIATGAIDYVLPPGEIARELVALSGHPFIRPPEVTEGEVLPDGDHELAKVFRVLRQRTRVDFAHYKPNTVRRRIGRRMIVNRIKTVGEYAQMLERKPDEVGELYRDLLISVTNFFRDPEVFAAIRVLLKDQLGKRNPNEPFRAWVAGCATGEEVYSLAICLKEVLDELQIGTPVQLFGTDISDLALDRARAAVYPEFIAQDVSPERLRRYFARVDRGYQVSKMIREMCVFARQDVTHDPPFGHIDLISCRNVLIYLDSALQRKVLPVFHYSLNPSGLLLLGPTESIAAASDLFSVVDKSHRIYGRKAVPLRLTLDLSKEFAGPSETDRVKVRTALSGIDLQKKADLVIQSKYAPAAVVIDADLRILHFRGRTGFYLEPSPGEASFDLLRMAREGLVTPLRKAVEAAANQGVSIRESGVAVEYMGERRQVTIEVTPIAGASDNERYFLVVFQEASGDINPPAPAVPIASGKGTDEATVLEVHNRELQRQVAELREQLRNLKEDHEAHTEELRASNEEVRSANEELQSTNEELSTTKEELQSANEELTTLNEELQTRNGELTTANSDLGNLLSAADFAFLIVDNDLRLRRFSTAAEKFLDIKAIDIGHPLTGLAGRMNLSDLEPLLRKAVETLNIQQRDIEDKTGHWLCATIRPYRTIDNRIAGAVIVLADIDALKRTLRAAEEARDYAEGLIETVRQPLVVLDSDLRVQRATSAFYETFHVSRAETENRMLYDLGNGQWNIPRLREVLGDALFRNQTFQDMEIEHTFPHIGRRRMRLNGKRISPDGEQHRSVLLAIEDVTERRQEAELRYQRLFETAKDGILVFDAETLRLTDVNPSFLALTGFGRERLMGHRLPEMEALGMTGPARQIVEEAQAKEIARHDGVPVRTSSGQTIQVDLVANRYAIGGQQVVQINVRDVTARNQAVEELSRSEERFRLFVESVRDYALFQLDLNGVISSWNSGAERVLGYAESEILGQPVARIFTPEDVANGQPEKELEEARLAGSSEDERWHVRKDGSRFFASGVLGTVRDQSGRLRGFARVMRDITEKNKAEEQLRHQAELLDLSQDLIMVRQLDGTIMFWNHSAAENYGWSDVEARGQISQVLLKTKFPQPMAEIEAELLAKGRWEGELIQTRRNQFEMIAWSRWALRRDSQGKPASVLEVNSDITERKRADEQLRASLQEKEVLLKEIHHRVKNNLQIISSLLNLQTEHLADIQEQSVLEEMNTRVRSIAAIHEMLYSTTDLSHIQFASYLNALSKDVSSFYIKGRGGIRFEIDCEEVLVDITQAVPCGLIVNELLTNGVKHAFPEGRPGVMKVSFQRKEDEFVMAVMDDGIGLAGTVDPKNAGSMGFQLLNLLVQQLKGALEIDRSSGTRFTITFPVKGVRSELN